MIKGRSVPIPLLYTTKLYLDNEIITFYYDEIKKPIACSQDVNNFFLDILLDYFTSGERDAHEQDSAHTVLLTLQPMKLESLYRDN